MVIVCEGDIFTRAFGKKRGESPVKKKAKIITVVILFLLLLALGIFYLPQLGGFHVVDMLKHSPEPPFLVAFAFIGIYCLKSVMMFIPVLVLYISAGAIFPFHWAIVITYIGLFCELSLGYWLGRRLGGDKVTGLINKNEKTKRFLSSNEDKTSALCFLIRLTPLSLDGVSMFFGASRVPYSEFLAFSLLGLTPKLIPFVLMGDAASNPLSKEFLVPFMVSGVVVGIAFIVYRRFERKV